MSVKSSYKPYLILAFLSVFVSAHTHAQLITVEPQYQQRYHAILEELRCLVCQNQTLADSSSELATDLRVQVKTMLEDGNSDQEILDFMSARYGDFVLYNPPVKTHTLFLWLGPFILLLLGIIATLVVANKRSKSEQSLSDEDLRRIQELLDKK